MELMSNVKYEPLFDKHEKPPSHPPRNLLAPRRKSREKPKEEETEGAGDKELIPII
jgi:hypothetical protein